MKRQDRHPLGHDANNVHVYVAEAAAAGKASATLQQALSPSEPQASQAPPQLGPGTPTRCPPCPTLLPCWKEGQEEACCQPSGMTRLMLNMPQSASGGSRYDTYLAA